MFSWITDELAVGGHVPGERTAELAREHGIAAVVDLREEARDDEHALRSHGIAFLHLPMPDSLGAPLALLSDGVDFARDYAGKRVLIHCQHGIGRSALLALCVLVDRGMPPLAALSLAKDRRDQISPSPAQFEAWARWLRHAGHPVPVFDDCAAIAYRHRNAGLR